MTINLRDWYSQQQVMTLLRIPLEQRMRIIRWRKKYKPTMTWICKKPFYLRQSVNSHLDELIRLGSRELFETERLKLKQIAYNISTREWMPRCQALERSVYKKTLLYALADPTFSSLIRTKQIYGFLWFNVQDLDDFMVDGLSVEEVAQKYGLKPPTPTKIKMDIEKFLLDK